MILSFEKWKIGRTYWTTQLSLNLRRKCKALYSWCTVWKACEYTKYHVWSLWVEFICTVCNENWRNNVYSSVKLNMPPSFLSLGMVHVVKVSSFPCLWEFKPCPTQPCLVFLVDSLWISEEKFPRITKFVLFEDLRHLNKSTLPEAW